MRRFLPASLAFFFALLSQSPAGVSTVSTSELRLDLPRAIEMALSRNFQLEIDAYDPQIARTRITTELGRFDPSLSASYLRTEDTNRFGILDRSTNTFTSLVNQTDEARVGLGGLLPWGTEYNAGVSTFNRRGSANGFADEFTVSPSVSLTQPLLRDFGLAANLAQVRIARTDAQISQWVYRQRIIDVITQVNFVYNELYFAIENLQVAERSQSLASRLLHDNERRAEIGVMSPLDITTARAEFAAREEGVILSRRSVRDNENFLKQLITDDIDSLLSTRLLIAAPPSPEDITVHVRTAISEALEWRPDFRQAQLDLQRRNISLAYVRNQALPRLDLTASLALTGLDNSLSNSALSAIDRDRTAWTAGAVFSVPIPNRSGRGRITAASLEKVQALVELKRLEQNIVVRVDNAAGQIITNQQRIRSTIEARKLAEESLEAGDERLRAGSGTTFETLELQRKLVEAQAAELRARSDFNKAVAEYERQKGTALETNGIVLTDESN